MLKDIKNINDWDKFKKRKFFWSFTISWSLFVWLIGGEWLYFIPFIVGDVIFWKTFNYTFWKKRKKEEKKPKGWLGSWGDAILFAVIAATILRTFFIEAYTIPTPSMEKSLMVGDYLFVDKTAYGPRVPMTPLSFPLVHHTLPLLGGQSYLEWLKLPYHRISGWKNGNEKSEIGVERNDCVVFNWPAERLGRPIDKKENYVKRCVALPGDELKIKDGILFINGKEETQHEIKENQVEKKKQRRYFVKIKPKVLSKSFKNWQEFSDYCYEEYDIIPLDKINYQNQAVRDFSVATKRKIHINATEEAISDLRSKPYIDSVWTSSSQNDIFGNKIQNPDGFLAHNPYNWDEENYGPISMPKAGETIALTSKNLPIYKQIIKRYEGEEMGDDTTFQKVKDGIAKNGSYNYEFEMNYYWLMGDNRQNSADSRFWGFVPENHIVGKKLFIWMSYDQYGKGIRWSRMYRPWMWVGIMILLYHILKRGIKWNRNRTRRLSK
tara:strand:+ start:6792 stop:8270 length:1479 start_codon:yes stop_codon:yes gene_type:complete